MCFRRVETAEGCAGGADERTKSLIWPSRPGSQIWAVIQALRPARRLQVEASGPGNAASVQQRLAGRFGGKFEAEGGCAGPGSEVDAPEVSSGPGWEIQEVSRVGAQGVTSKSKLWQFRVPGRVLVDVERVSEMLWQC